ncbi:MAG: hypothetical protein CUN55_11175, partial [Phototrophicales bacterium]
LTNAHLVTENRDCISDRIVVALTIRIDEPPVPSYSAEVIEINRGFNLAVLQITRYLDGRSVDKRRLQLPFVELGDSDATTVDQTIYFFGYPDLEGGAVQMMRGTVSGFTAEARVGERAWIRTAADVPGLFSGGGAYDRDGRLIGIPTVLPNRVAGEVLDCRVVYDTNGDNRINDADRCIPIPGLIRAIRPSRLALGLVRAAALGIQPGPQYAVYESPPNTAQPIFENLFLATSVNEAGMPVSIVSRAPSGISSLYLFFDYRNMTDGLIYELRTTVNGRPDPTFSLPPVTWNGGPEGLWYIGNSGTRYENGTYEFTLFIEGRQVDSISFVVGGAPNPTPQFSDLVFGLENSLGQLVGANYVIPEGNVIRARFRYQNMEPGVVWRFQWFLNGSPLAGEGASGTRTWELPEPQGTFEDIAIASEAGFISGTYRLQLEIERENGFELAVLSDVVVAGGAGGIDAAQAQIFSDFQFAQNQQAGFPIGLINDEFASGVGQIFVFFNWRQISPNTPWTYRWLLDGDVLFEEHTRWAAEPTGENFYLSLVGLPTLPDASYTLEILMNGIPLTREVTVDVGLGQLPVEAFASAEGVQVRGRIIDAETGQGIAGAMLIILRAEFSVEDWVWDESQVLSRAQADRNGYYQIPQLLPRGTTESPILYSLLVRADGYFPVSQDGIPVTDLTSSPIEINVVLNRD